MNETATGTQTETQPTVCGNDGCHADGSQFYRGGVFVTPCRCGAECEGISPDDADGAHFEHIDEYQVPVDPMTDLECDSCQ